MKYKPDFEEAIPRLEAFWRGEFIDRPCMDITAPKGKPFHGHVPDTIEQRWTDQNYIIENAEAKMESTYFAGEAVPIFRPNLGPDLFSALLGGTICYNSERTSWVAPFLDWNHLPSFEIDENSFEWQWHIKLYDRLKERSPDRYFVTVPDCHSGGDALLAMRGGTDLCMDIYDHPEEIKTVMKYLEKALVRFNEAFQKKVKETGQNGHVTSWLRTWSPVFATPVQLDLLALISPAMFEEFFLNEVKLQCHVAENTIFHLDGPDAIKHLPIICELPVNAVQWVPGAGQKPMIAWLDLLKEIQSYGKGLHLSCHKDEVEVLVSELSSNGLYICTSADSPEEADELLKTARSLAHK
ncbi:MAG: hypothetical protein JXN60_07515 [Lentisphaerae bacterium]|nr:hypothetical protein [Lentisphaerota bacterium]